jgi:hypothetical protein
MSKDTDAKLIAKEEPSKITFHLRKSGEWQGGWKERGTPVQMFPHNARRVMHLLFTEEEWADEQAREQAAVQKPAPKTPGKKKA